MLVRSAERVDVESAMWASHRLWTLTADEHVFRVIALQSRSHTAFFPDLPGNAENVLGDGAELVVEAFHIVLTIVTRLQR